MHHYSGLLNIPPYLRILRLLIRCQSSYTRDRAIDLSHPKLSLIDVPLEDRFIGIALIPLQVPCCPHQRNHLPQ
ncbi:MAG: hypothetical protein JWQ42_4467 [Edaphobacter sp.]|nr:hypothetical protein [Edaphobacter sp.]